MTFTFKYFSYKLDYNIIYYYPPPRATTYLPISFIIIVLLTLELYHYNFVLKIY